MTVLSERFRQLEQTLLEEEFEHSEQHSEGTADSEAVHVSNAEEVQDTPDIVVATRTQVLLLAVIGGGIIVFIVLLGSFC